MRARAWGNQTHPDLAAFDGWTRKAVAARGVFSSALIDEGIRLVEARRKVLRKLMRVDPSRALAADVPERVRAVLPPVILSRLETPFPGEKTVSGDPTVAAIAAPSGKPAAVGVLAADLGLAPVINSSSAATGFAGQGFTYRITATDSPTRFDAVGLPPGVGIDTATGFLTGVPAAPGIYLATIAASNGAGGGRSVVRITVHGDDAPVILSATTERAFVGQPFSYQIIGFNSPTSYDAAGLPAGLGVDPVSGLISGTPTAAATALVTLVASNAKGVGRVTLLLYVDAVPAPSANDDLTAAQVLPGTSGSLSGNNTAATREAGEPGHAGNAGGRSLWYTWTAPVDGRVSFDTLGSAFDTLLAVYVGDTVGTLAEIGGNDDFNYYGKVGRVDFQAQAGVTYRIAVDGFDGDNGLVSLQYREETAAAPQITSALTADGVPGVPFDYRITGTNNPYTFTAVGLPIGFGIDPTAGHIVGVTGDPGTYTVTIAATNLDGEGTAILTLTIGPAGPPVINSVLAATGRVGSAFNYQVTATNSSATYGATGLPAGITINAGTGLLSGTPAVAGVFSVVIRATNSRGATTKTLMLTVNDLPTVTFVLPGAAGSNHTQILEGGPPLKVRVLRTGGDASQPLTVTYKPKGGNVPGQDYKVLGGTVTIPAGATSAKIKVRALDDGEADGNKTLKLKLAPAADGSYKIGTPGQAKIRIVDLQGVTR